MVLKLLVHLLCILSGCLASGIPGSLVQVSRTRTWSSEACCRDKNLLSCQEAMVDPDILDGKEDIVLADVVLSFKSMVPPNGYVYQSPAGDEAVITFNAKTGNMFGNFETSTGRSFSLEKCTSGHTWKEFNVTSFEDISALELGDEEVESRKMAELRNSGAEDTTTPATYSVMFYYTADFEAITADIPGFIDQVLAETNQGYINSKIPLTVTKFCIEAATINDMEQSSDLLRAFYNMKSSTAELRNTADAAALLAADFSSCGRAFTNTIWSGNTLSITQKSCALGYYSFGHELAHNMGATHNEESATNGNYDYGHGHLIEQGMASKGYRTILAYWADGHSTRVNYYSNPNQIYPPTGTPLGEVGVSNNARVLMENRLAMQAVGDESGTCSDGSLPGETSAPPTTPPTPAPTTPTTPPTTAPTSAVEECAGEDTIPVLQTIKKQKGVETVSVCSQNCNEDPACDYYKFKNHKKAKKRECHLMKIGYSPAKNWWSAPKNCTTTTNIITASAVEECAEKGTIPVLQTFKRVKKVESVSACSQKCNEDPACEYYKWKNAKKANKRDCQLMRVKLVAKKKWSSAPRNC